MTAVEPRSPELPAGPLRIERVDFGHPDALVMVEAVQQEYVVRYGGIDETPLEPEMFLPPRGSFFVGYAGDVPVASGAWRRREDVDALGTTHTAEVKRMYVAPAGRGRGYARAMLAHLEATAREAFAEATILETGTAQPEAIGLYLSSGYAPIADFGHYCAAPESRCFGKRL